MLLRRYHNKPKEVINEQQKVAEKATEAVTEVSKQKRSRKKLE